MKTLYYLLCYLLFLLTACTIDPRLKGDLDFSVSRELADDHPELITYLDTAMAAWSVEFPYTITYEIGGKRESRISYGPTSGYNREHDAFEVANAKQIPSYADMQAVGCVIQISRDHFPIYPQRAIVHELGHCLGLGHSPDTQDVMYLLANPVILPSENDLRTLKELYQ